MVLRLVDNNAIFDNDINAAYQGISRSGVVSGFVISPGSALNAKVQNGIVYFANEREFDLDSNTIGLWHLNEGVGIKVRDASPNGFDGTMQSNNPNWVDGKFSRGLEFTNTTNNYVNIPDNDSLDGFTQFTLEAWAWFDIFPNDWGLMGKQGGTTNSNDSYGIGGNSNNISFMVNTGAPSQVSYPVSNITTGVWHHIAGVYDGVSISLWIDGIKVVSTPKTGTVINSPTAFSFGTIVGSGNSFDGKIDEVRLSSIARNPAEYVNRRVENFSYGLDAATKGLWYLNEAGGGTAVDSKGNQNGTYQGTITWEHADEFGITVPHFDGSSNYVSIPDNSAFSGSVMCLEAWIRPDYTNVEQAIISKYVNGGPSASEYHLYILNTGVLQLLSQGTEVINSGSYTLQSGKWYHVMGIVAGANSKIYINGVLVGSGNLSATTDSSTAVAIGARSSDAGTKFKGVIHSVRISNIARTAGPNNGVDTYLDTANSTNPRKDLVTVDWYGRIKRITGTPDTLESLQTKFDALTPKPPDIPVNEIVISEVYVAANATTLTVTDIKDRRVGIFYDRDYLNSEVFDRNATTQIKSLKAYFWKNRQFGSNGFGTHFKVQTLMAVHNNDVWTELLNSNSTCGESTSWYADDKSDSSINRANISRAVVQGSAYCVIGNKLYIVQGHTHCAVNNHGYFVRIDLDGRSVDSGFDYDMNGVDTDGREYSAACARLDGTKIYWAKEKGINVYTVSTNSFIYRTYISPLSAPSYDSYQHICYFGKNNDLVLVQRSSQNIIKIAKSSDEGVSWTQIGADIPVANPQHIHSWSGFNRAYFSIRESDGTVKVYKITHNGSAYQYKLVRTFTNVSVSVFYNLRFAAVVNKVPRNPTPYLLMLNAVEKRFTVFDCDSERVIYTVTVDDDSINFYTPQTIGADFDPNTGFLWVNVYSRGRGGSNNNLDYNVFVVPTFDGIQTDLFNIADTSWEFVGSGTPVTNIPSKYETLFVVAAAFTDFGSQPIDLTFNNDTTFGRYVWGRVLDTTKSGGRDSKISLGTSASSFASSDRAVYSMLIKNSAGGRKYMRWQGGMAAMRLGPGDGAAGPSSPAHGVGVFDDGGSNAKINRIDITSTGGRSVTVFGCIRNMVT